MLSVADMDDRVRICSRAVRGKPWFVNKIMRRRGEGGGRTIRRRNEDRDGGGGGGGGGGRFRRKSFQPAARTHGPGHTSCKTFKNTDSAAGPAEEDEGVTAAHACTKSRRGTHVPDGGTSEDGRAEAGKGLGFIFTVVGYARLRPPVVVRGAQMK